MTPNEQRMAIAEACGFVWYKTPPHRLLVGKEYRLLAHPAIHEYEGQAECWLQRADGTETICSMKYMEDNGHIPDYLEDLNAMHDAWNTLNISDKNRFEGELFKLVAAQNPHYKSWLIRILSTNATAAQRAEAFLRLIGKWKPSTEAIAV